MGDSIVREVRALFCPGYLILKAKEQKKTLVFSIDLTIIRIEMDAN